MNIEQIKKISYEMRKQALDIAFKAGKNGAHLGGGLSAIEIFSVLYSVIMTIEPNNRESESRDRLIVSKGHCVLAYYTALNRFGFLSNKEIEQFEQNGAFLHGHATRSLSRGIEFSGGSLGMGLPFAVGVAMAMKRKRRSAKVYCVIGDGECDEGSIWEAAMCASHYHLDNLVVIVDKNGLQYDGSTQTVMDTSSLRNKFSAFGFETQEVDGHSEQELVTAFNGFQEENKPKVIVAFTVKGKGVSFMENVKEWHHAILSEKQYQQALLEISQS